MRSKKTFQAGFQKGMIMGIKQDQFQQQESIPYDDSLNSAFYLENFDPNLEFGSIVSRLPYQVFVNEYSGIYNGLDVSSHNNAHLPNTHQLDDIYSFTKLTNEYNLISHIETFVTSSPSSHRVFACFLKDKQNGAGDTFMPSTHPLYDISPIPSTRVMSLIPEYDTPTNYFQRWSESFKDGFGYPGWYTLGHYADSKMYGEAIYFTTLPENLIQEEAYGQTGISWTDLNDYKDYLYPVYKYYRWDLTKAREGDSRKFLRGITISNLSDKDKYRRWKVKTPALELKRRARIIKSNLTHPIMNYKDNNNAFGMLLSVNNDFTYNKVTQQFEHDIYQWDAANSPYNGTVSPVYVYHDDKWWYTNFLTSDIPEENSDWIEVPVLTDKLEFNNTAGVVINEGILYTHTILDGASKPITHSAFTSTNVKSFVDEYNYATSVADPNIRWEDENNNVITDTSGIDLMIWEEPHTSPQWYWYNVYSKSFNNGYDNINWELYNYLDDLRNDDKIGWEGFNLTHPNIKKYKQSVYETIELLDHKTFGNTRLHDDIIEGDEENVLINDGFTELNVWNLGKLTDTNYNILVRTVLPNYVKLELPRPFLKGEVIPIVLTARTNGGEIILKNLEYTVQNDYGIPNQLTMAGFTSSNVNPTLLRSANTHSEDKHTNHYHIRFDGQTLSDQDLDQAYLNATSSLASRYYPSSRIDSIAQQCNHQVNGQYYSPSTMLGYPMVSSNDSDAASSYPHVCHNYITVALRFSTEILNLVLESEVTSFRVYIAESDPDKTMLQSVGTEALSPPPEVIYHKAVNTYKNDPENPDYSKYRLFKEFVINGLTQGVDEEGYKGDPIPSNGWVEDNGYYYAVPHYKIGDTIASVVPGPNIKQLTVNSEKQWTDRNESYLTWDFNTQNYSKDFIIYEIPAEGEVLTLENSGQYWDGTGAKLIEIIQGRVFIGGCYDTNGEEETAIIRFSATDNGSHLHDVFPKENKIQIGSRRHTALKEFRDTLIVWNNYAWTRMQPNNIFSPDTWEFVESVKGQGCFSQKMVVETPYGVCFAGNGGIFITDGTAAESITDNFSNGQQIQSLYEYLMMSKRSSLDYVMEVGSVLINDTLTGPTNNNTLSYKGKHNLLAELIYDQENDELILSTPIIRTSSINTLNETIDNFNNHFHETLLDRSPTSIDETNFYQYQTHSYKLIFNFNTKTWRAECLSLTDTSGDDTFRIVQGSTSGRMIVAAPKVIDYVFKSTPDFASQTLVPLAKEKTTRVTDYYSVSQDFTNADYEMVNVRIPIVKTLITHNIGDGINDYLMIDVNLECTPQEFPEDVTAVYDEVDWRRYEYNNHYDGENGNYHRYDILPPITRDPILFVGLRSSDYLDKTQPAYFDIVNINMKSKAAKSARQYADNATPVNAANAEYYITNPFKASLQTPLNTDLTSLDSLQKATESLQMIAPLKSKFRRSTFKLITEVITKVRSLKIEAKMFERRNY